MLLLISVSSELCAFARTQVSETAHTHKFTAHGHIMLYHGLLQMY